MGDNANGKHRYAVNNRAEAEVVCKEMEPILVSRLRAQVDTLSRRDLRGAWVAWRRFGHTREEPEEQLCQIVGSASIGSMSVIRRDNVKLSSVVH